MTSLFEVRVFNLFLLFLLLCLPLNQSWAPQAGHKVETLLQSARRGDAKSQHQLAALHQNGKGVKKDEKEAVSWLMKAANQGDSSAQNQMGIRYEEGRGVEKDPKKAFFWYEKGATQGNSCAQHNLGLCYADGKGVPKDKIEAAKWFAASAEQGNAWGQYCLGVSYGDGSGVPKNKKKAVEWFLKAAEQGHIDATFNIAKAYQNGNGVDQDSQESFRWYQKAADLGDVESQSIVGWCFATGLGTPKIMKQALFWTRKAAEQGNLHAQLNLAECYKNGEEGLTKDPKLAARWYALAAAQEDPDGQYNLGSFYETGFGVAKDEKTALEWYSKAAAKGHVLAKEKILLIKNKKQPETTKIVRMKSPSPRREDQESQTFSTDFVKTAKRGVRFSEYVDAGYRYNFERPNDPQNVGNRDLPKGEFNLYAIKVALEDALAREEKTRDAQKDRPQDIEKLTLLAEKGDAESQYLLGVYYETKNPQNINDAFVWYSRSAEQGHGGAKEKLRSLEKKQGDK